MAGDSIGSAEGQATGCLIVMRNVVPNLLWIGNASDVADLLPRTKAVKRLIVADVDGSPGLYEVPEFLGKVHGHGETAWVSGGKIVATSGLGRNTDCFQPNTAALLSCE